MASAENAKYLAEWSDTSEELTSSTQSIKYRHCRSVTPYRIDISTGVTLSWKDISCFAPEIGKGFCGRSYETGRYRQLLFDVSGVVQPYTLMAVMGASGAGKTTLLNILTCRNLGNLRVEGQVKANGVDMGPKIKCVSAYVQQNDIFDGRLKVREHLTYHAALRMGRGYSKEEQLARVETVISDMGLEKCADDYIVVSSSGSSNYGISGSERKLLSITTELLTDPPLIFCDEPTTGLDSMMAEHVVRILQKQARLGKTIICTIHQPASHIFEHFDELILLAEGRLAFQGSIPNSLQFFTDCGLSCPQNYNPADHFIHTLAIKPGIEKECRTKVVYTASKFRGTDGYAKIERQIKAIDKMEGDPDFQNVMLTTSQKTPYRATWWKQISVITWKMILDQMRDPKVMFSRILQNFISILVYCILYFQQDSHTQVGVMNLNGASFNLILHTTFLAVLQLNTLCQELSVFYRQHHNGLYRTDTYYIARNLADIPLFVILMSSVVIICYWILGYYPGFVEFLIFSMSLILVYQFSMAFNVYLIGVICGRVDIALNVAPPVRVLFMLVGGYTLNEASIPFYLDWLKYFSWQRYSFKIIMQNQWSRIGTINCESGSTGACYKSGAAVLSFLHYEDASKMWLNFVCLVLLGFVWRFLAWLILWIKARERNRN